MSSIKRLICTASAAALLVAPTAIAAKPDTTPAKGQGQGQGQGKAKAYGKYCQNESKKHVAGQKGTPFSACVKAMAKAADGDKPKAACKGLSKKHVKGEKGTPYSRCVVAAAQARKDAKKQAKEQEQAEQEQEQAEQEQEAAEAPTA